MELRWLPLTKSTQIFCVTPCVSPLIENQKSKKKKSKIKKKKKKIKKSKIKMLKDLSKINSLPSLTSTLFEIVPNLHNLATN